MPTPHSRHPPGARDSNPPLLFRAPPRAQLLSSRVRERDRALRIRAAGTPSSISLLQGPPPGSDPPLRAAAGAPRRQGFSLPVSQKVARIASHACNPFTQARGRCGKLTFPTLSPRVRRASGPASSSRARESGSRVACWPIRAARTARLCCRPGRVGMRNALPKTRPRASSCPRTRQ